MPRKTCLSRSKSQNCQFQQHPENRLSLNNGLHTWANGLILRTIIAQLGKPTYSSNSGGSPWPGRVHQLQTAQPQASQSGLRVEKLTFHDSNQTPSPTSLHLSPPVIPDEVGFSVTELCGLNRLSLRRGGEVPVNGIHGAVVHCHS